MIGFVRGRVVHRETVPPSAIVEAGGVGYELRVSTGTLARLAPGREVEVYVHTHLGEGDLSLFGFGDLMERNLFRRLIGVSSVGPRLAMDLLSGMAADDLVACIRLGRKERLQKIKGIGRKTAERLVLELQDRLDDLGGTVAGGAPAVATEGTVELSVLDEALEGLLALGYSPEEARRRLQETVAELGDAAETADSQVLLRETLRRVSAARVVE